MPMEQNKIYQGNCLDVLKNFPDESINCVVTSPPYWGLRDYHLEPIVWGGDKSCKHEWDDRSYMRRSSDEGGNKNRWSDETFEELRRDKPINHAFCRQCNAFFGQLGLEPTLDLYLKHMLQITAELKRVLKSTGILWWNHGDSYGGSGSGTWKNAPEEIEGKEVYRMPYSNSVLSSLRGTNYQKCLLMQNYRLAMAMVDQQNWTLRDQIIWAKKIYIGKEDETAGNAMPESVKDRCTKSYEPVFMFTKNKRYWSDFDAIRVKYTKPLNRWGGETLNANGVSQWDDGTGQSTYRDRNMRPNHLGANRPNTWQINTKAFSGSHFAVFPPSLIVSLIKAGCPQWVCKKCGKPRERLQLKAYHNTRPGNNTGSKKSGTTSDPNKHLHSADLSKYRQLIEYQTTGWTDCGCNAGWKQGIVLDPFMGAGTTAVVAQQLKRNWIGIELSQKYIDIAYKRLSETQLQQKYSDAIVDTEQKPRQQYLF